jgi:nucleotide-binding universal stress UspA family protein
MRVFRRILHATDFSSASRPALARAIALARQNRAKLWVAHARPPLAVPVGGNFAFVPPGTYEAIDRNAQQHARKQLRGDRPSHTRAGRSAHGGGRGVPGPDGPEHAVRPGRALGASSERVPDPVRDGLLPVGPRGLALGPRSRGGDQGARRLLHVAPEAMVDPRQAAADLSRLARLLHEQGQAAAEAFLAQVAMPRDSVRVLLRRGVAGDEIVRAARAHAARFDGRARGLGPGGQLHVEDSLGRRHAVVAGEVRLLE